ncbi:OadG family protein, partial [bacterium]|nr:OadG family protein [bacterium]
MNNLENGLALLLIGMGTVLAFLTVLIFAMGIMSKIVGWLNKIFPEAVEEVKSTAKKVASNVDEAIAVAIAAIMAKRRSKHLCPSFTCFVPSTLSRIGFTKSMT